MSENQTKPSRPEPVLQPMRVIQVEGPAPVLGMPDQVAGPTPATINNPSGKKLVMSKKELEAEKRAKSAKTNPVKPNMNIPYNFPGPDTVTIDNSFRNAAATRNVEQKPDFDESWLLEVGGTPVSRAWLQTAVSISGFISSESTFSPQQIMGLTMTWKSDGLWCQINSTKSGKKVFLVPEANVKIMEIR